MAVQNASSGKSHRFAPTRELHADYNTIVPATDRDRKYTRELREFLKRSDEDVGTEKVYPIYMPPVDTPADTRCGEEGTQSWPSRMEGPLLRKIAVLRRALYLAGKERKEAENGVKLLIKSARESTSATASIISHNMPEVSRQEERASIGLVQCAGDKCGKRALPYSRYCLHHVSSDEDQVLYGSCRASDAGSGLPCGSPVLDFLLNQPLCSKHVTKAALESTAQQQKRKVAATNRLAKTKAKVQKSKKVKAQPAKVVIVKTSPATSTVTLAPVIPAGSTSSWSSEDSDGGNPATNAAKRVKVEKPPAPQPQNAEPDCLPSLTPETLDLSLTTLPLPSLILPPPLPDIGKFMDDSSSEES